MKKVVTASKCSGQEVAVEWIPQFLQKARKLGSVQKNFPRTSKVKWSGRSSGVSASSKLNIIHYAFREILTHFVCFLIFFSIYLHRTPRLRQLKWFLKSRGGEMPVFSNQKVLQHLNLNFNII